MSKNQRICVVSESEAAFSLTIERSRHKDDLFRQILMQYCVMLRTLLLCFVQNNENVTNCVNNVKKQRKNKQCNCNKPKGTKRSRASTEPSVEPSMDNPAPPSTTFQPRLTTKLLSLVTTSTSPTPVAVEIATAPQSTTGEHAPVTSSPETDVITISDSDDSSAKSGAMNKLRSWKDIWHYDNKVSKYMPRNCSS